MSFAFNALDSFNSVDSTDTMLRFAAAGAPIGATVEVRVIGSGLWFDDSTGVMAGTISELQTYDVTGGNVLVTLEIDDTHESTVAGKVTEFLQDALAVRVGIIGWNAPFSAIGNPIFEADGTSLTINTIDFAESSYVTGKIRFVGSGIYANRSEFAGTVTTVEHLDADGNLIPGDTLDFASDPISLASAAYVFERGQLIYEIFSEGDDTVTRSPSRLAGDEGHGNALRGGAGNNTLQGDPRGHDAGDYSYSLGPVEINLAKGIAIHANGTDTLLDIDGAIGSPFSDVIVGDAGRNELFGEAGNDRLIGGLGMDLLLGNGGADIFDFNTVKDSRKDSRKGANVDFILDFQKNVAGERIDLRDIDAIKGTAKNDAFKFIGAKAFTHHAGELHTVKQGHILVVEGDINGDGRADFQIGVEGVNSLTKGDFIL